MKVHWRNFVPTIFYFSIWRRSRILSRSAKRGLRAIREIHRGLVSLYIIISLRLNRKRIRCSVQSHQWFGMKGSCANRISDVNYHQASTVCSNIPETLTNPGHVNAVTDFSTMATIRPALDWTSIVQVIEHGKSIDPAKTKCKCHGCCRRIGILWLTWDIAR